jgi:hypothetical protein
MVRVPRQVFMSDVFAGTDEPPLRRLDEQLAGIIEYVPDVDTCREMRLLRVLTEPELEPGDEARWGRLYFDLGLEPRGSRPCTGSACATTRASSRSTRSAAC